MNWDGFIPSDRCRQDGMKLPILAIALQLSQQWGKEARRPGAKGDLAKGFTISDLLSKVDRPIAK